MLHKSQAANIIIDVIFISLESLLSPVHQAGLGFSRSHASVSVCVCQALKEIARVSKELCSYQDEIRKKSGDRR